MMAATGALPLHLIGKFEVVSLLGRGAMGAVYQARDPTLDRLVAIKTISPHLVRDPEAVQRFQREARAAARLQHPNVVTVYELGEADGTQYIAMELLDGTDLGTLMKGPAALPLADRLRYVTQACRGLDYAHKKGVVHRDVKPANVQVTRDGNLKIVDFGIARLGDTGLTQTGMVVGTPPYMAPEVLTGKRGDHRCDMWALGVILYELLSGRRPFDAPTFVTLAQKIVHDPLPPLDARALGVPPALVEVVARALAKKPTDRFTDLAEMLAALDAAQGRQAQATLDVTERRNAYLGHLQEANRYLEQGSLERALLCARMAEAFSPSGSEAALLAARIEDRLSRQPLAASAPSSPTPWPATPAPPVALPPTPPPLATRPAALAWRDRLRAGGASAFRDQGAFGEPPATQAVVLDPARALLASAGSDGAVRLWDLRTRSRRALLRTPMHVRNGHDARPLAVAFTPDGQLVATGHVDGAVHVWSTASGAELPVKLRHEGMASAVAFSPSGAHLATGGIDSTLKVWEVAGFARGEARRELHRQPAGVSALLWVSRGQWIVTGHVSRILRLQDAQSGRLVATLRGPQAQVHHLTTSPDGRYLTVGSHDRTVRIIDLQTREETASIGPLKRQVAGLAWFADGTALATVAGEHLVQAWDPADGTALTSLWGAAGESYVGVAILEDGQLVSALADGRLRVWSLGELR
jgi:serine/threonine protein kinase/WD40 repeat protein